MSCILYTVLIRVGNSFSARDTVFKSFVWPVCSAWYANLRARVNMEAYDDRLCVDSRRIPSGVDSQEGLLKASVEERGERSRVFKMVPFNQSLKVTLVSMTCYVVVVVVVIRYYRSSWEPGEDIGQQDINPDPKIFLNSDDICENGKKGIFLLIMILSAVVNFERRNEIRASYLNVTQYLGCEVRHVFLLARIDYVEAQKMVGEEAARYNDVVQFDFDDRYVNLARKTLGGLYWVNSSCSNAKYVVKTDDDVLILPQNAVRLLAGLSADQERTLYSGRLQPSARPVRNYGKWRVAKEVYPYLRYPPYVWGLAIIMSMEVIQRFSRASKRVPQIHVEDAYIGLLARATGIKPKCNTAVRWGFKLKNYSAHHDYCRFQNVMLLAASFNDMAKFWEGYSRAEQEGKSCDANVTRYLHTGTDICPWPWVAMSDVLDMVPADDKSVQKTCASLS
ncbi:beta-1,3-galactosyltransferase 1-like [Lineus longissimus]|uniref:beta-1,3-galactosyltransferase 1-like n=1 Tax=Lineus longissimus TaxID=88925 RepID=UPI002B4D9826